MFNHSTRLRITNVFGDQYAICIHMIGMHKLRVFLTSSLESRDSRVIQCAWSDVIEYNK